MFEKMIQYKIRHDNIIKKKYLRFTEKIKKVSCGVYILNKFKEFEHLGIVIFSIIIKQNPRIFLLDALKITLISCCFSPPKE